jgi:cell division septation protein DedD
MKNSETGEYELVVGNKQVVSAFFVVALLCGVAFAMGYVVGANAPHSAKQQPEAAAPAAGPESRPSDSTPSAATPSGSSQPADSSAQSAAPGSQGDAGSAESAPKPEPPPQPVTQAARESPQPPPAVAEAPGSYWQVYATRQPPDAQPLLQTLKDGGMPATLRTGVDGWTRILVGPYPDATALSTARTTLETRFGIKNLIRR